MLKMKVRITRYKSGLTDSEETTLVEIPMSSHTNNRMTGKGVLGC